MDKKQKIKKKKRSLVTRKGVMLVALLAVSVLLVNIITEMTNLIDASRAYEANATAFNASKSIAQQGLQMGQS